MQAPGCVPAAYQPDDARVLCFVREINLRVVREAGRAGGTGGAGDRKGTHIPPEVLTIIAQFASPALHLVRGSMTDQFEQYGHVKAKWLASFMSLDRKPSDAPFGDALTNPRAKTFEHWESFAHGHSKWTRKQWSTFLMARLTKHIRDPLAGEFLARRLYDHSTRFYVEGRGGSPRHTFLLYEPYLFDEGAVATALRAVLGTHNFDRFVRLRQFEGCLQIFFFGPAVDMDSVMQSSLFVDSAYFNRRWSEDSLCQMPKNAPSLSDKQNCRHVSIRFASRY